MTVCVDLLSPTKTLTEKKRFGETKKKKTNQKKTTIGSRTLQCPPRKKGSGCPALRDCVIRIMASHDHAAHRPAFKVSLSSSDDEDANAPKKEQQRTRERNRSRSPLRWRNRKQDAHGRDGEHAQNADGADRSFKRKARAEGSSRRPKQTAPTDG